MSSNELSEKAKLILDFYSEGNQPPAIQSREAQAPRPIPWVMSKDLETKPGVLLLPISPNGM